MGLDASDVERIIHYGPSDSIESYIQETGRCGRDGRDSSATLYFRKRDIASNSPVSDPMKMYCGNTGFCRRKLLMRVFEGRDEITFSSPIHNCCDVCERECSCKACSTSLPSPIITGASVQSTLAREQLSPHQQSTLHKLLTVYRDGQCGTTQPLLFGKKIASGVPNSIISSVVKNAHVIHSPQDIADLGISSPVQCRQICNIVQSMF